MINLLGAIITQTQEPMAGSGWDLGSTIYIVVGSVLSAGGAWLGKKLIDLINAKVGNELARGILGRLAGSINDAVAMVNQTVRKQIEAAKSPTSPGGERITQAEKKLMFDAVWQSLKEEYGGWGGMFSLLQKIGLGETGAKTKINNMIEAAVLVQKKTMGPRPPAL